MSFQWDPRKAARNARKHRVSFDEATSVFLDPWAITYDDPDHSLGESREITIGCTLKGRILFVSHTDRGTWTRIISARPATRAERKEYEKAVD